MRKVKSDYLRRWKGATPLSWKDKHTLDLMQASYHKVTLSVCVLPD